MIQQWMGNHLGLVEVFMGLSPLVVLVLWSMTKTAKDSDRDATEAWSAHALQKEEK